MKGIVVSFMKKWWVIAVVFALSLSLTSCARRRPTGLYSGYGINYCDGTMGQIDVYTSTVETQADTYKIILMPVALATPGDIVSVTVVNQSTLAYKTLLPQVVLNVDQQVNAGYLSGAELNQYDLIAITTFTPGMNFLEATPEKDAICGLPFPGDGVTQ